MFLFKLIHQAKQKHYKDIYITLCFYLNINTDQEAYKVMHLHYSMSLFKLKYEDFIKEDNI